MSADVNTPGEGERADAARTGEVPGDDVRELVRRALAEDVGAGDVTTDATVPEDQVSRGEIVVKAKGVVAGLEVARAVFEAVDPVLLFSPLVSDGAPAVPGTVVATVEGRTRSILTGERVALNFLQRLSGIATATARCVSALEGTSTRLLDTRKTTPGLRALEKAAVRAGGGENHRMGLWDMVLIKDNHIEAAGSIPEAVSAARSARPGLSVEVEAKSIEQVAQALSAGADRIMLDNMTDEEMRDAIALARAVESPPEIEVSGSVSDERLRDIGALGADFVSVGALTHSAPALDISLELTLNPE